MYLEYWGLKEKPFENTPDPRFFYHSARHEEAFMRLLYAVQERKGCALLSGEIGSGKTLLSRVLFNSLLQQENQYKIALIINPAIPKLELLSEIVYQLGAQTSREDRKIDILHKLNELLYKFAEHNMHTVVIVDEAQTIEDEAIFEEIRLLLNFQLNDRFLLTVLLLGQPEVLSRIDNLPQFKQRLALSYHLANLTEQETRKYVEYRCKVSGREEPLFSEGALKSIYIFSQGLPRQINKVCDLSLVVGMGNKASIIDERITQEIINDIQRRPDIMMPPGLVRNG